MSQMRRSVARCSGQAQARTEQSCPVEGEGSAGAVAHRRALLATAIALERQRMKTRGLLRKQILSAKEARFQRSLRHLNRDHRRDALARYRAEAAREEARYARLVEDSKKRVKKLRADAAEDEAAERH